MPAADPGLHRVGQLLGGVLPPAFLPRQPSQRRSAIGNPNGAAGGLTGAGSMQDPPGLLQIAPVQVQQRLSGVDPGDGRGRP
jgi:hypothetical protein